MTCPAARLAWLRAIGTPSPDDWYRRGGCEDDSKLLEEQLRPRKRYEWVARALERGREAAERGGGGGGGGGADPLVVQGGGGGGRVPGMFAKQGLGGSMAAPAAPASAAPASAEPAKVAPPGLWAPDGNMEGLLAVLRERGAPVMVRLGRAPAFVEGGGGGGAGEVARPAGVKRPRE